MNGAGIGGGTRQPIAGTIVASFGDSDAPSKRASARARVVTAGYLVRVQMWQG
jgi:hypothetical protein